MNLFKITPYKFLKYFCLTCFFAGLAKHIKITNKLSIFIIALTISLNVTAESDSQPIQIAFFAHSGDHRFRVKKSIDFFIRENPGKNIEVLAFQGIDSYNDQVERWLKNQDGPQIILWYGGSRIENYAKRGLIQSLDDIWQPNNLNKHFPTPLISAVTIEDEIFAIPITSMPWVLHYSKKFFKKLNISPDEIWNDLLGSCRSLKKRGVDLFAYGSQTPWATHAWFDYLNLRINGIDFYKKVLKGRVSYKDQRIKNALLFWKELLDNDCFNENHGAYTIWESFPRILHEKSAFSLLDGIPVFIERTHRDDIGISGFPLIKNKIPPYTLAPVNVFVVPIYTRMTPRMKKLLLYISGPRFQSDYNRVLRRNPARLDADLSPDSYLTQIRQIMQESPGGIQFFDRDTDINLAKHTPKIFTNFMEHTDIDRTTSELEKLRLEVFGY